MSFDLETSPYGYLRLPTTGVSRTSSIAFPFPDHIKLYNGDRHILSLLLQVHLVGKKGERAYMELRFEHVYPDGCLDMSQHDCSDNIPDDAFPFVSICGSFPFIAGDDPVTLKLQIEGNFLVARLGGDRFMGKVSLPPKKCDLSQERQVVTGASQEGFTRYYPRVCI